MHFNFYYKRQAFHDKCAKASKFRNHKPVFQHKLALQRIYLEGKFLSEESNMIEELFKLGGKFYEFHEGSLKPSSASIFG